MSDRLPEKWIDALFTQLLVTYGRAFTDAYAGQRVEAVKEHWAKTLGGSQHRPWAMKYAIEHLPPDRPPNVLQFKALLQQSPDPPAKALPGPPYDPAKARAVRDEISRLFSGQRVTGGALSQIEWALKLKAREESGDKTLTYAQRRSWREVFAKMPTPEEQDAPDRT